MNNKKGFTLVELLVVISIIALLLAVLIPSLSSARQQGQSLVCRSNLKQLGSAAFLWAEDNGGWSVATSWFYPKVMWNKPNPSSLEPYTASNRNGTANGTDNVKINSVYACPSARREEFSKISFLAIDRTLRWTYGANSWMVIDASWQGYPGNKPEPGPDGPYAYAGPVIDRARGEGIYTYLHGSTKLITIRQPANTVYFTDFDYCIVQDFMYNPATGKSKTWEKYGKHAARWHARKAGQDCGYGNMVWVDGRATKEPSDFTKVEGTKERWRFYFYDH
ncbi:MAG: type II secretion system protein [Phycisphaerales bacterium]